jgi:hypothetical protein
MVNIKPPLPPQPPPLLRRLPLLLALPPLPRRHGLHISPEPLASLLGSLLGLGELALLVVLHVPPGEPLGDQLPVHMDTADTDVRDDPAVAIFVDPLDLDLLALDQIPEGLAGDVAERLGLLGGVDAVA